VPASKFRLRPWYGGLLAGVAVTLAIVFASATSGWQGFEERSEALFLTARPQPWNPDVVLVALDDQAVRKLPMPIPRTQYARLIDALSAAGVKAIGLDLFFTAPVSDSPQGDQAFASALTRSGRAVIALPCNRGDRVEDSPLASALARAFPPGPTPAFRCETAIAPYGPLAAAATVAEVVLARSSSGANRGEFALVDLLDKRLPTLSVQMYLAGNALAPGELHQDANGLRLGSLRVPLTEDGELLVHDRVLPDDDHMVSIADLFAALPKDGPAQFHANLAHALAGKYVVIGATSAMLSDVGPQLDGSIGPLVLFHVRALSDLLEGHVVHELAHPAEIALIVGCGLFITFLALAVGPVLAALGLAVTLFGLGGGAMLAAQRADVLVAPLGPAVAAVLAFLFALAARTLAQERDRRILRQAFGEYVDKTLVDRLLEQGETFALLQGKRKPLTVLFSDIQGYTGMSNEQPPEVVFAVLRDYFAVMIRIVLEHKGRIDKIMGDGILAVFGDPVDNEEHAKSAVAVGHRMQHEMTALRRKWADTGKAELSIRVGIATGEVFVGNIGAQDMKIEYTVLGPTVNLASRLEGKAPVGSVLVSHATFEACWQEFDFQPVPNLALKGFPGPYTAHLLLGPRAADSGRRQGARVEVDTEVELVSAAIRMPGRVRNASATGLFIECVPKIPEGAPIEVQWRARDGELACLRGRVEHRSDAGVGISLEGPAAGAREQKRSA
jgi:class 3 adenylate cyclase